MTFFQNLFAQDFEGNWLLGDRHHIPKFVCPRNAGRGDEMVTVWNEGPYDLTGQDAGGSIDKDLLDITFALNEPKNWATIQIDIGAGAASLSAVTPAEISGNLNSDTIFAERFTAYTGAFEGGADGGGVRRLIIKQLKPITQFRFYVNNSGAEEALGFNARAGVGELPTYFDRHTVPSRFDFDDSQNQLFFLDPANAVEANIINNAVNFRGVSLDFTSTTVRADYALLEGRSGLFDFTNDDGSSSPNTKIIYPAGAVAGDLAKKSIVSGTDTFVIPYTLLSTDLITPP